MEQVLLETSDFENNPIEIYVRGVNQDHILDICIAVRDIIYLRGLTQRGSTIIKNLDAERQDIISRLNTHKHKF